MDRVRIPSRREVRGVLDGDRDAEGVVVASPPHPQMGGSRSDRRLQAVGDALSSRGIACLRFDYGPWDEGEGEQRDVQTALEWGQEHYDLVGAFGYSFGAGVTLLAAAAASPQPTAVSLLAPPARLDGTETTTAIGAIDGPLQVIYGERDDAVDWKSVVARTREHRGTTVTGLPADHHFVGQDDAVGTLVATFFEDAFADA